MDAAMQGVVLIGAAATALGGVLAWFGAKTQAKSALRAVEMQAQARAQRDDGLWRMRRDARAVSLRSVETFRSAMGQLIACQDFVDDHPGHERAQSDMDRAFDQFQAAFKEVHHERSVLALSLEDEEERAARVLGTRVDECFQAMGRRGGASEGERVSTETALDASTAGLARGIREYVTGVRAILKG
ncbi:hypothetical protein ACFRAO_34360 [Streptomyces sp. NPDC056656]|uniref:hypothetical protein n=1 Tax=Streptomyces sp. NPDC056656 TaxID=3345895 RepID=UPI00368B2A60